MFARLRRWYLEPDPARLILLRLLDKKFRFLDFETSINIGSIDRPAYAFGLLNAARLARRLGYPRFSAIEFGVAGGNGLLALERLAAQVTKLTGVGVDIYGFDAGAGMPAPVDYRDLPYLWQAGYFKMDVAALQARLGAAKLVLGPVKETLSSFAETSPAPVGFIAFDLDYYSSTIDAMKVLDFDEAFLMPRIVCYFDDLVGVVEHAFNEFTGELLAIADFNAAHPHQKISPVRGMRFFDGAIPRGWHEQIYIAHHFRHSQYATPIAELKQLPLA